MTVKAKDYKRGYQDGISACCRFLIEAQDLPTIVEDMKQYVLPNRNWRKRFYDISGIYLRRRR